MRMKVKEFLNVLNMEVKYKIVDKYTREIYYNTEIYKRNIDIKELFEKNIYMVFPSKEDDSILDIRVF
jgi:lipopolysaccharide biosynthesis protein